MEIRLTTLIENSASGAYAAEWGLSILVEADGRCILLDAGPSAVAMANAQIAKRDIARVDTIAVSHGHVDHTGGLRDVLRRTNSPEVIAHPDMFSRHYLRARNDRLVYVGIPFVRYELESLGARFNLSADPVYITSDILTTGEIPLDTDYEAVESNLLQMTDAGPVPDPLADDLSLIIKSELGLVVVLGCAHRGVVNTLRHAIALTGVDIVHTVVGGTHLMHASPERIDQTIVDLLTMGVQRLGVSHCTGFEASMRLYQAFGDGFFLNSAGTVTTVP